MPLKLFISYSRDDTDFVEALTQMINELRIKCVEYFIDRHIAWGDPVTSSIKQGIKDCTDLLVIISEKSTASMWVGYEIGIADALEKNILMFLTQENLTLPSFVSDINYKTRSDLAGVRDYLESRASQPLVEEFLERIGHKNNQIYRQIDSVYVPPAEFDSIKWTLEDKRIVLITGPREFGKTFTAVRLLWEYFRRGYEPQWKRGTELINLEEDRLRPRQIVYFEDPFGTAEYRQIEGLERQIATILALAEQSDDAYVIITSPEEVYKEFKKGQPGAYLDRFEKRLKLATPSYSAERRRKILLLWAEKFGCKWLRNSDLKNFALTSLEDDKKLPTPLSIKNFAISSADATIKRELDNDIMLQSKATEKVLENEIDRMPDDMVLFLAFPLLSDFDVDWVKNTYEDLVENLDIHYPTSEDHPWSFEQVLDWFEKDKIELIETVDFVFGAGFEDTLRKAMTTKITRIRFSHPSYSGALALLSNKKKFIKILDLLVTPLLSGLGSSDSRRCILALSRIGEPAVEPLIRELENDYPNVRIAAAQALSRIGEPAVEPLIRELENDYPNVRIAAATALGSIRDPRATQPLIDVLFDDEVSDVRAAAATALGWKEVDKPIVLALRGALHDEDPLVRRAAGNSLKHMKYWEDGLYRGLKEAEWPQKR